MKIITAFLIFISFNLYPQWALWANPSLPVGSADNGIGLWAGQIMVSNNYNYQFIDWSHGPIGSEDFEHIGTLSTHLITPTITLGLSDYINISYTQAIGVRSMGWDLLDESLHHRDENSSESFDNALGSLFGDGRLSIKYLLTKLNVFQCLRNLN